MKTPTGKDLVNWARNDLRDDSPQVEAWSRYFQVLLKARDCQTEDQVIALARYEGLSHVLTVSVLTDWRFDRQRVSPHRGGVHR